MQAIEFETRLENGVIQLPPPYRHWQEGRLVRVIVLAVDSDAPAGKDLNVHARTIAPSQSPLAF